MKKWVNKLGDVISGTRKLRAGLGYLHARANGLQYGSYTLVDEVALASSFVVNAGGGAVLDAGANKGEWSQFLLESGIGAHQLIICEPQAAHADTLSRIQSANANTVFEQVAVGALPGEMPMYADDSESKLASFYKRDLDHVGLHAKETEHVELTTIEALAEKHNIDSITFLKLDVEGHELEALKGATSLLQSHAIEALAFEFGGCNIDSRTYMKDFWSLLVRENGYQLFRLLPGRRLLQLNRYSEDLELFSWQNILACAPGIRPHWPVIT